MDVHHSELPYFSEFPPGRREGQLELRVWDATEDQLALGLATAREIFRARRVTPDVAGVCSTAVSTYEADPTLAEPDAEVRAAAAAFGEASDAAIRAAAARSIRTTSSARVSGPTGERSGTRCRPCALGG